MTDDSHLIEHRLSGSTLLAGGFLEVHRDAVRLPDGSTGSREYIRHSGAVAVVPLLDDGRCVLVRQYRYPVAKVLLEWPAGRLDSGESTLACAMRELQEETGYSARDWAYGGEIHNAAAYSTESIWLWFARGLVAGDKRLDAGEFVETVLMTPAELDTLALRGELQDVKTQIGLSWLQRWQAGGRSLPWQTVANAHPQADDIRRPPPEGVEQSGTATFAQEHPQADDIRRPPPEGVEQSGTATFAQERRQ